MASRTRHVGLGFLLVCLFATLLVGLAIKAPCASGAWTGNQYRHLCYSDIVPLLSTEQLQQGSRLPFLDACKDTEAECDEYPVLTMYTMRLAAWLAPTSAPEGGGEPTRTFAGFFYGNVAILTIAAVVIAVSLYLLVGTRALLFAIAPTLLVYAFMNWDLLAVAFATAATLAYLNRRDLTAGGLLGLGAAAKLYPALLLVPFVLARFRDEEPDRGIHLAWAAAGAWMVVNLPFALSSPSSWWEFFRFNSLRPADWDSLWFIGCHRLTGQLSCSHTGLINAASLVLFVGGSILLWRIRRRREPDFARWTFGFPLLVVFLLTNKVYSPQYGLWLLPWFALTLPDLRIFVAFGLADVAVFVTRFSWFGRLAGVGGLPIGVFEVAVLIRTAVLIWSLAAWVREGREEVWTGAIAPAESRSGAAA